MWKRLLIVCSYS
jgi:hypothetical protein